MMACRSLYMYQHMIVHVARARADRATLADYDEYAPGGRCGRGACRRSVG